MKARRLPIALFLIALVVVAIIAGDADAEPRPRPPAIRDAVAVAPASAISSAWYCPGPSPSLPLDAESVVIANLSDDPQTAVVTAYPDDLSEPLPKPVEIGAQAVLTMARLELGPAGPVTVETFSSDLFVESGLTRSDLAALGPCATTTAREWHFAAGTTERGIEQYLTLFNPLGTDAKVNVALHTDQGVLEFEDLLSLDVPRRSRIVVPIHEYAIRQARVAVDVEVSIGRVVASQELVYGEASGARGVTRSLGIVRPDAEWTSADGFTGAGSSTVVALSNPGSVDAEVDVYAPAGIDVAVAPVTVVVPRQGVVWVPIGGCGDPPAEGCVSLPDGVDFAVEVATDTDTPVVAELLGGLADTALGSGAATLTTPTEAAARWVIPTSGFEGGRTVLAFTNTAIRPVEVSVAIVANGETREPPAWQGIEVDASQRRGLDLTGVVEPGAAIVVTADGPIAVQRSIYGGGDFSRAAAVPAPETA